MLWTTLFNRVGKVPLRISQHRHVTAIINDETMFLELKYTAKGEPYFVKAPEPTANRKFSTGQRVKHTNGWVGKIVEKTPDPERFFVINLNEYPRRTQLIDAKYLKTEE